jgi:hypothetical protein
MNNNYDVYMCREKPAVYEYGIVEGIDRALSYVQLLAEPREDLLSIRPTKVTFLCTTGRYGGTWLKESPN